MLYTPLRPVEVAQVQPAAPAVAPFIGPAPVPYAPAPSVTLTPGGGRGPQAATEAPPAPAARPAPPTSYLMAAGARLGLRFLHRQSSCVEREFERSGYTVICREA